MLDQSEAREMQAASVCVALQFCCVLLQREVEREAGRRGEERRGEERTSTKNKTFIGILNLGQKSGFGNLLSLSAMKWRQRSGRWVNIGM